MCEEGIKWNSTYTKLYNRT